MVDVVTFKSLKLLRLEHVSIDEEMIKCLTTSCPLLEELDVKFCYGYITFYVYGIQNLKKVWFSNLVEVDRIDIEAPNLCEFHLFERHGEGREAPSINMASCKQLKTLDLRGYPFSTSKGFYDFLYSFPFLESLFLDLNDQCKSLKLSSPFLRKLVFYAHDSPKSRVTMECCPVNVDTFWFQNLKRFLDKTNRFEILKLHFYELPPSELEHVELQLGFLTDRPLYLDVVHAILGCCRPRSPTLVSDFSSHKFVKWNHLTHVVQFFFFERRNFNYGKLARS
ncbi:F-box domain containing protein [Tanacetum coccineum]